MYILGINISHHSSIALLKNGELVYFLEEERLSKIKYSMYKDEKNYLYNSITNIDLFNSKILKKITNKIDEIIFSSYMTENEEDNMSINLVLESLKRNSIEYDNVTFKNQHHIYHAFSALFQSGFKEAGCLVLDGAGSYLNNKRKDLKEVESIYKISNKTKIKPFFKHYSTLNKFSQNFSKKNINGCEIVYSNSLSCGQLFNKMVIPLGFNEIIAESGKLMGLSSYGKIYRYPEKWFMTIDGVQISNNYVIEKFYDVSKEYYNNYSKRSNVCKKLQEETLQHTLYLIEKTLKLTQSKNLILSGGYFLNCVNNYRYLDYIPKDVKIYIDPISNDNGTALGAAYYIWYLKTNSLSSKPINNIYLGPQYSKEELLEGIKKYV